jgi:sulfonate transport system substrate-binding protein
MKRTLRLMLLAMLFLLPLHSRADAELPKEIRFGEVGGINVKSVGGRPVGTGLVELASHLGYFDAEFGKGGPKITQVFFTGTGPAQNEGLAQGTIDFGFYGGVPNVLGLASGIPAHIVMTRRLSGAGRFYIGVSKNSPINSIADLRGKRIGVQKGTGPYEMLVRLLEWKGIAEKDVTLINLTGSDALVAMNAGSLDAVYGGVYLLLRQDQGDLKVLEGTNDYKHEASQSGMLVATKFEKDYPDTMKRVVKVLINSSYWASDEKNRQALLQFIAERSVAFKYVEEDYRGSLKERFNPLIDESSVAAFKALSRFCAERKLIRADVSEATVRSWFRPEYQQAALKELKLENYWTPVGVWKGSSGH